MSLSIQQLERDYTCCLASLMAYEPEADNQDQHEALRSEMFDRGFNLTCEFDSEDRHDVQFSVFESADELIIAFRGTSSTEDLIVDLISARLIPTTEGGIGSGVYDCANRVFDKISTIIYSAGKRTTICGHSIGGAIASAVASFFTPDVDFVVTFGSPRVGDDYFQRRFDSKIDHHRWVNGNDLVTRLPFPFGRFRHTKTLCYITVGTLEPEAWFNPPWWAVLINRWGWFKRSPIKWATTSASNHPLTSYHESLKSIRDRMPTGEHNQREESI